MRDWDNGSLAWRTLERISGRLHRKGHWIDWERYVSRSFCPQKCSIVGVTSENQFVLFFMILQYQSHFLQIWIGNMEFQGRQFSLCEGSCLIRCPCNPKINSRIFERQTFGDFEVVYSNSDHQTVRDFLAPTTYAIPFPSLPLRQTVASHWIRNKSTQNDLISHVLRFWMIYWLDER
jgi:hypothetical protein